MNAQPKYQSSTQQHWGGEYLNPRGKNQSQRIESRLRTGEHVDQQLDCLSEGEHQASSVPVAAMDGRLGVPSGSTKHPSSSVKGVLSSTSGVKAHSSCPVSSSDGAVPILFHPERHAILPPVVLIDGPCSFKPDDFPPHPAARGPSGPSQFPLPVLSKDLCRQSLGLVTDGDSGFRNPIIEPCVPHLVDVTPSASSDLPSSIQISSSASGNPVSCSEVINSGNVDGSSSLSRASTHLASVDPKVATQVTFVRGKAIRFETDSVDGLIVHASSSDDKLESSAIPLKSDGILQKVDPKAYSQTRGSGSRSSQENGELIDSAPCNKSKDIRGTYECQIRRILPSRFGLLRIAHRKLVGHLLPKFLLLLVLLSSLHRLCVLLGSYLAPWEKKKGLLVDWIKGPVNLSSALVVVAWGLTWIDRDTPTIWSFISCLAGLDLGRTAHLTLSGVCSGGAFSPNGVADMDTLALRSVVCALARSIVLAIWANVDVWVQPLSGPAHVDDHLNAGLLFLPETEYLNVGSPDFPVWTPADIDEEVLLGYPTPVLTSPRFRVGDRRAILDTRVLFCYVVAVWAGSLTIFRNGFLLTGRRGSFGLYGSCAHKLPVLLAADLPSRIKLCPGYISNMGLESHVEVFVVYQWNPFKCGDCRKFGHTTSQCKSIKKPHLNPPFAKVDLCNKELDDLHVASCYGSAPARRLKVGSTMESSISPAILLEDVNEPCQLVGVTDQLQPETVCLCDSDLKPSSLKPAAEKCGLEYGVKKHSPFPCNIASSKRQEAACLRVAASSEDAIIDHRGSSSRGEGVAYPANVSSFLDLQGEDHDLDVLTFDDVELKMTMFEARIAAKEASPNSASRIATEV
ncbi:hypothetical protein Nepgr_021712 [Nepenthes gracilis]|uniref:Uncharacterized protein n=1 Tax=Nepenthes gracilis TaxID=150966 RepID=A0AAD3SZH6_NEPGR|nr:hypothetical protein Nepgr_021712 [Nepenthes gracilis]